MIYLIGMPGVGKSFWAREIAQAFKLPFIDTDDCLELQEGCSVATLYWQLGVDAFRVKEREVLEKIAAEKANAVVACGGGTPCYHDNISLMLESGTVVYLKTTVSNLVRNLHNELHRRPMLAQKDNIEEYLAHLLEERRHIYEKAHHIVDASFLSVSTFAQILNHV